MGLYDLINPITYFTNLNGAINDIRNRRLLFGGAYFDFYNYGNFNIFANPYQTPWPITISNTPPQNNSIWSLNNPANFNIYKLSAPSWNTTPNYNPFINPTWNIFSPTYNFTGSIYSSNTQTPTTITKTETTQPVINNTDKTPTPQTISTRSYYMGQTFANNAKKYLGYNEKDGSSNLFSNSKEWCADFVTYVVKESYSSKGLLPPKDFGDHSVENLKQWGIDNNNYLSITDSNNKAKTITDNVKIGDIMILRENGASHTGFVSQINPDGSFKTIEGNRGDKVAFGSYKPDDPQLSGFVQLS